jgi:hypothetical protein
MLPKEIKELLEDVEMSTKKITAREIVLFDRHSSKEDIDELKRLTPILSKAVVEDNTEVVRRLTTTISKIVKQKTDGKDDHRKSRN